MGNPFKGLFGARKTRAEETAAIALAEKEAQDQKFYEKCAINKAAFYQEMQPYIDEGLLSVIYDSKRLTIVNVIDVLYAGVSHANGKAGDAFWGWYLPAETVRAIFRDEYEYKYYEANILRTCGKRKAMQTYCCTFNDRLINHIREMKPQRKEPAPDVDLEMEYELGVRQRPEAAPKQAE